VIVEDKKSCINIACFDDCFGRFFSPHHANARQNPAATEKGVLPLVDDCKHHSLDRVHRDFEQNRVTSDTSAPQTTYICRMLDLTRVGVFKIVKNRPKDIESRADMTIHITTTIHAIQEIRTVPTLHSDDLALA
jgi:hypothetical protein